MPRPKKRGSRVGFVIDPYRRREVWFESRLEEDWAVVLVTKPNVIEVREQQAVRYRKNGRDHTHFVDYVVTWKNGLRTAFAVKYVVDVDDNLVETLRLVSDQAGDRFADDYRIATEKQLTKVQIENAKDILACGADGDAEGRTMVADALRELPRSARLAAIADASGLGARGYRAAIALVQEGALEVPKGKRIAPDAVLHNRLTREDC